jgi:hypothetical protein
MNYETAFDTDKRNAPRQRRRDARFCVSAKTKKTTRKFIHLLNSKHMKNSRLLKSATLRLLSGKWRCALLAFALLAIAKPATA